MLSARQAGWLALAGWVWLSLLVPAAAEAAGAEARAQVLMDQGRPEAAAQLLQEAVAQTPDDAKLHFLLGVARTDAGDPEAARAAFERAVALKPDFAQAHYNLGALQFQAGLWKQAEASFLAAARNEPALAGEGYLNAGLARYKAGDVAGARELFRRSVEVAPRGGAADSARKMLAVTAPAPERPAAEAAPTRVRPRTAASPWRLSMGLSREHDGNVFLSPDDPTTQGVSDWRTQAQVRAQYRTTWGRFRFTPSYAFFGRWYSKSSNSIVNYRSHAVRLRLDDRSRTLHPRLEYEYLFSELSGQAYLASHEVGGRLTLTGGGGRYLWAGASVKLLEAPGSRYEYLSGTDYQASLSGLAYLGEGRLYGALAALYRDRGARTLSTTVPGVGTYTTTYSYAELQPSARWTLPVALLGLGTELELGLKYEYRAYADTETWDFPSAGSAKRRDHRYTTDAVLAWPLPRDLSLELSWQWQVRVSNLDDHTTNYPDRDYTKTVYGLWLRADM